VAAGDAAVTAAAAGSAGADMISGWVGGEHVLDFAGSPAGGANYAEGTGPVADYATAYAAANLALDALTVRYYAAEITGSGVIIFNDNDFDGTFETGEDAVLLIGRTLADIGAANII